MGFPRAETEVCSASLEVSEMAALLEQFKAIARIAMYLILAFMVIQLWQDPGGAADWTMNFIGSIGHFFSSLIDKIGEFVGGLGGDDAPSGTTTP
jgi:hypothetical protein